MRLRWRKARRKRQEQQWVSPLDPEVIRPGDEGWKIFEAAMRSEGPVIAVYDASSGEIVEIKEAGRDRPS